MAKQQTEEKRGAFILWQYHGYYIICDAKNVQMGAGVGIDLLAYHPTAKKGRVCADKECAAQQYTEVFDGNVGKADRCPGCMKRENEREAREAEKKRQQEATLKKRKDEAKRNS
jgi:hypothetical protein